MFNDVRAKGSQALHGIWSLGVAQENGFTITEIPPSEADVLTYGDRPREAEVYYKGQYVGTFAISERRESAKNPRNLLRWLSKVPLEVGSTSKRIQINLDPIQLKQ